MLNKFDLEDFNILQPIPIVDVPKNSYIRYYGDIFKYLHSDAVHATCEDMDGRTVFLKTWAIVYPFRHKDADKPIPFNP